MFANKKAGIIIPKNSRKAGFPCDCDKCPTSL